jgi:hypothetical protein
MVMGSAFLEKEIIHQGILRAGRFSFLEKGVKDDHVFHSSLQGGQTACDGMEKPARLFFARTVRAKERTGQKPLNLKQMRVLGLAC